MVKKKEKKKNLNIEARHFGVVLENIDSKLDLVVEGHEALDKKIDKVDKKVEDFRKEVNYKFEIITEVLSEHGKILTEHGKILTEHGKMIASIKRDIEIMKQDIEFIKHGFKKKVDIEEFAALERRVAILEKSK